MSTTILTRKSKVGFGYSSAITEFDGDWYLEKPLKLDYYGTILQVANEIDNDLNLKGLSNTYYATAWFVKVKKEWKRIKNNQFNNPRDLLNRFPDGEYEYSLIEMELDQ